MSLKDLFSEYGEITEQIKIYEDRKTEIREKIAEFMHLEEQSELISEDITGKKWKAVYQSRESKSVDHVLLLEKVGQSTYNNIVTISTSQSLNIRLAPKSEQKKDSLVNQAPVPNLKNKLPIGKISH